MRVSYEWLKTMVALPDDPADLVREYARTGTEVEAVEKVGSGLDHVVTGKILTKERHPDSDHMWVTTVDVGSANVDEQGDPQPLQIVCGAQNFEAGDHNVVALVGAELPGGVRIKKSKLRGVESCGMNCSERELGLGGDHSGIMILPDDAPVGMPIGQYLGTSDTVIDCEITPNRGDCLSMYGMARETSAVLDEDWAPECPDPEVPVSAGAPSVYDKVDVRIDAPDMCQRYCAAVVSGVKIGPSPEWLARRVTAAGARPINNVVDVTNYVMFLTGQPLHAFDLGKLSRGEDGKAHIVVRAAREGERLVTLDGQERQLTPDMCVITDSGERPVALAGVMGGENSRIDEGTCDVLLESATFSHEHVSRTSRNLQLFSEAAMRYERGVNADESLSSAKLAAKLFVELCGAQACDGIVDEYPKPVQTADLVLRCDRLRAMMGAPISDEFAEHALSRLGCLVEPGESPHTLHVRVSLGMRPDLSREIDLYEEVARLWGEGDIPSTIPAARNHAGGLTVEQARRRKAGATLRACGLNETICYNFVAADELERLRMSEEGRGSSVRLMNPMSSDWTVMRRTLLGGLVRAIAYNQAHGTENVALYETGRVYFGRPGKAQPKEREMVAGVLAGKWDDDGWNDKHERLDFFDAKGVVESLLSELRVEKARFKPADPASHGFAQPGRAAEVLADGKALGWVAELHPAMLKDWGVEPPVAAFELDLEALIACSRSELPYRGVPTLPAVEMDLALTVDENVTCERLEQVITSAGGKSLESVRLFDVYRDPERVGAGKKSMAFSLTWRAADHTMTSEEAESLQRRVIDKAARAVGAAVRGE